MWSDAIEAADVAGRSTTAALLPERPREALAVARKIRHPWYRCQALTLVSEAVSADADALRIVDEARHAAREQVEPNRVVTVAMWPLRRLLELRPQAAGDEVRSLTNIALSERHGLRRLHALDSLLATVVAYPTLRHIVAEPYLHAARLCYGWRAERIVAFRAEDIALHDPTLAHLLLADRQSNRFTDRARRVIAALPRRDPPVDVESS